MKLKKVVKLYRASVKIVIKYPIHKYISNKYSFLAFIFLIMYTRRLKKMSKKLIGVKKTNLKKCSKMNPGSHTIKLKDLSERQKVNRIIQWRVWVICSVRRVTLTRLYTPFTAAARDPPAEMQKDNIFKQARFEPK